MMKRSALVVTFRNCQRLEEQVGRRSIFDGKRYWAGRKDGDNNSQHLMLAGAVVTPMSLWELVVGIEDCILVPQIARGPPAWNTYHADLTAVPPVKQNS